MKQLLKKHQPLNSRGSIQGEVRGKKTDSETESLADTSSIPRRSIRFLNPLRSIQGEVNRRKPDSEIKPLADTSSTTQLSTINVVLFGETGVGKSSVINLIAQKEVAKVSSNVDGCTMQSTRYTISFDDMNFAIFDTIGLEEPQYGVNGYLKAIEKAYELIMKLSAAGGIHLLLFCMRGGRITATTQSNYRLFCECLCSTKVPIALVFTGLEREEEMEDWWGRNKNHIEQYGIKSNDHACITAVRDDIPGEDLKYTESQKKIRELLRGCASLKDNAFALDTHSWFAKLGKGMRSFIEKHKSPKKKDVLKVLTTRCKLDPETAKKIAEMMEKGDPETNALTDGAQGGDGMKKEKEIPQPQEQVTEEGDPETNALTDGTQGGDGMEKKKKDIPLDPAPRERAPNKSEGTDKPATEHPLSPKQHRRRRRKTTFPRSMNLVTRQTRARKRTPRRNIPLIQNSAAVPRLGLLKQRRARLIRVGLKAKAAVIQQSQRKVRKAAHEGEGDVIVDPKKTVLPNSTRPGLPKTTHSADPQQIRRQRNVETGNTDKWSANRQPGSRPALLT